MFLCMLALHFEWHMRRRLAPMLFEDDGRDAVRASRRIPVGEVRSLESARRKAATGRTGDGLPVLSFRTLLDGLPGVMLDRFRLPGHGDSLLSVITTPTPAQEQAFPLSGVKPDRNVPIGMAG